MRQREERSKHEEDFHFRREDFDVTPICSYSIKSTNRNENVITKKLIRLQKSKRSQTVRCAADGMLKILQVLVRTRQQQDLLGTNQSFSDNSENPCDEDVL